MIRFFLLVHLLEDGIERSARKSWKQLDVELCALANRVQAAKKYSGGDLQVKVLDSNPTTPPWFVKDVAKQYLPRSYEHRYIAFSAG